MNKIIKLSLSACLISTLAACSWLSDDEDDWFRDRSDDYRKARVEKPLELPEHLKTANIEDTHDIPPISDNASLSGEFDVPRPERLEEDALVDAVRINKMEDQRWILVDGAPGEVWPRLRAFLTRHQLRVVRADAVHGILETDWLQPAGEETLRERFRLRIEQGVQRGTTEVYVLQADIRAEDSWPKTSSNEERETLIINTLAQYLADNQVTMSSVSMLAQQAMGSAGRISLEEDEQRKPYLQLFLSFERAWASLGLAVKKAGFVVEDLDRSQRVYYVRYFDRKTEQEEPGFWSNLFSFGSDEEKEKGIPFLLRVESNANKEVLIKVDSSGDEAFVDEKATDILKRIKKHLT